MSEAISTPSFPVIPKYVTRWRYIKDKLAAILIGLGGGSVIAAIALIFCYLLYEVAPLFESASMTELNSFTVDFPKLPKDDVGASIQTSIDELGEVLFFRDQLGYQFIRTDGKPLGSESFADNTAYVASSSHVGSSSFGVLDRHHQLSLFDVRFEVLFPKGGERYVSPSVFGLSQESLNLGLPTDATVLNGTFRLVGDALLWVAQVNYSDARSQQLLLKKWSVSTGLFDDEMVFDPIETRYFNLPSVGLKKLLIGPDLRWIYALNQEGTLSIYDTKSASSVPSHHFKKKKARIISSSFLLGGTSVLLGDSLGNVTQLSPVRDQDNEYQFDVLREFNLSEHPIVSIEPEHRRKGFAAYDAKGTVFLANTTAHRVSLIQQLDSIADVYVLSPRADRMAAIKQNSIDYYDIDNHHPEISFKSLWREVWYEGYEEPQYLWQSSAANNDFEPKLSLVPLSLGTIKAAFYAMLFAMPLAIFSAIYTAYFMAPRLRRKVKPAIELMEALPTVILGFLAGLWLAPLIEEYLPGVFIFLFITPFLFLMTAVLLSSLSPSTKRFLAPAGWEPLALIPVLMISVFVSFSLSHPIQNVVFGGDVRVWLEQSLGVTYDQRNALVVGFAMGFAVIPTIFSITEDAVFSVPKSLTQSSLALGASAWQTLVRVIIPTASPGIFSAVMIGFGRAVGETMIVLMATGNTPVMNFNIFEGFRTLSANIAVELPEAEVHSTHFRVLFLSALVLFVFTFLINTTAEFVRQRLREKYGRL